MSEYTKNLDDIYLLNDRSLISSFSDSTVGIKNPIPTFDLALSDHNELTAFKQSTELSVKDICSSISNISDIVSVNTEYINQLVHFDAPYQLGIIKQLSDDIAAISADEHSSIKFHANMYVDGEQLECTELADLFYKTNILNNDHYLMNGTLVNVYIDPLSTKLELSLGADNIAIGDGDVLIIYSSTLGARLYENDLKINTATQQGNIMLVKAGVSKYDLLQEIANRISEDTKLQNSISALSADLSVLSNDMSALSNDVFILSNDLSTKIYIQNIDDDGVKVQKYANDLSIIKLTYDEYATNLSNDEILSDALYVVSSDTINAYGQKIQNVAEPTDPSDATPKFYVDSALDKFKNAFNCLSSTIELLQTINLPTDMADFDSVDVNIIISSLIIMNSNLVNLHTALSAL